MDEPLTEELLNDLLDAPSIESYLEEHAPSSRNLAAYLNELLGCHGLERKDVVRRSGVNETYGYMLFTGKRDKPSRDVLLPLAFAMGLSLRETDRLLQAAGVGRLYCKNRRDAIIMFCLNQHATLTETNDVLYAYGEKTVDPQKQ